MAPSPAAGVLAPHYTPPPPAGSARPFTCPPPAGCYHYPQHREREDAPPMTTPNPNEPIAVVGMACNFPGAPDLAAFWRLLEEGRNAITEGVPGSGVGRIGEFYPESAQQTPACRFAGLVDGIDLFDADFFRISPVEAQLLDPQQRMTLETCWKALEDALIDPERPARNAHRRVRRHQQQRLPLREHAGRTADGARRQPLHRRGHLVQHGPRTRGVRARDSKGRRWPSTRRARRRCSRCTRPWRRSGATRPTCTWSAACRRYSSDGSRSCARTPACSRRTVSARRSTHRPTGSSAARAAGWWRSSG